MINGVEMFELRTHSDERGFFREIFRFSECSDGISVGQMSHSLVNEGVVKAWHGHVSQSQWNYVVNGKIQVVLYDDRNDSSTYGELMEFIVGEENVIGYLWLQVYGGTDAYCLCYIWGL